MLVRALEVPIGFGAWPDAWNLIAWSGPLGVLAMLLFAMNIMMTVRQQPSASPENYRPSRMPTVPLTRTCSSQPRRYSTSGPNATRGST